MTVVRKIEKCVSVSGGGGGVMVIKEALGRCDSCQNVWQF